MKNKKVFVQTVPGSFNHQAYKAIIGEDPIQNPNIEFAGTQENTFKEATQNGGLAFVALRNDIVEGNLVPSTVKALKQYRIKEVIDGGRMRIEMCVLRSEAAAKNNTPIEAIKSHPAALKQVGEWKNKVAPNATMEEEPNGTAAAAKQLSEGEIGDEYAVIAPKSAASVYPNLVVTEEGIQDIENNYTHFALVQVEKRDKPTDEIGAQNHLQGFVDEVREAIKENLTFAQSTKGYLK